MSDLSAKSTDQERSIRLPAKVVISLRAGAVLAVANIICVIIFTQAWTHVKSQAQTIQVTGSARRSIESDLIVWSAQISASDADLTKAYDVLQTSNEKTIEFLKSHGIHPEQMKISAVETFKRRERDQKGNETPKIVAYELSQNIQVSSSEVSHVAEVGRQITELIKDGVVIESNQPSYIYTKLADLKVTMLGDATKDATTRAQQIAANSGAKLGKIIDARMGVMQINPVHTYDATGSGQNDTTSFEKEITAVVSARFELN